MKVIYHKGCADGICSAALLNKDFDVDEFYQANYGEPFPFDPTDQKIIIADFSYPREVLLDVDRKAADLIVFDHHKTARADCEGLSFAAFDMNKCGAMMVAEWIGKGVPDVVRYVQDRDLWTWALPKSREVSAALSAYPKTVREWDLVLGMKVTDLMAEGEAILRYQDNIVEGVNGHEMEFAGYVVPVVNSTTLISEIGNKLCKGKPFAVMYFDVLDEGKRVYSLRSDSNGLDVSEIAKQYGGGGHKNAAGFTLPLRGSVL